MENTIEHTWKEGFLSEQATVVPQLNRLYDQKSNHLIDRLLLTGRRNIIGIIIGAGLVLLGFTFAGNWPAGLALFLLLAGLAYFARGQGRALAQIDKGQNSYQYLRQLQSTLQEMSAAYVRIYRWFYPLIILLFGFGLLSSTLGQLLIERVREQLPSISLISGIPTVAFVGVLLFALAFGLFAKRIYQEDVGLIYGPLLRKLDEMLAEMEHLR